MRRTNIYLGEEQSAAVEDAARARGISRAELPMFPELEKPFEL